MANIKSKSLRSKKDWIEMFPYGLAFAPGSTRPVMIFKDKSEKQVLPVWLSQLDAGIAVSQSGGAKTDSSPHHLTWKILDPLGVELEKCFFTEVRGHYQFVDLHFKGSAKLKKLESRADEAISFCLSSDCRFFCRIDFMDECRVLDGEMAMAMNPMSDTSDIHPYIN